MIISKLVLIISVLCFKIGGYFNFLHIGQPLIQLYSPELKSHNKFKKKRHVQAVGHANSNQPNSLTNLNQPNIATCLSKPNTQIQFFTGSEHVHRTS